MNLFTLAILCLRALVTNLLCAKNVRRNGDFYGVFIGAFWCRFFVFGGGWYFDRYVGRIIETWGIDLSLGKLVSTDDMRCITGS